MSLLEHLWECSGCAYLSDLNAAALSRSFPFEIPILVRELDASQWSRDEWGKTIAYMTGSIAPSFATAEEYQLYLLAELDRLADPYTAEGG